MLVNGLLGELYIGCVKVIIQRIEGDIRDNYKALSAESICVEREIVNHVIFLCQVNTIEIMRDEAYI
jgi:hypothetical protein